MFSSRLRVGGAGLLLVVALGLAGCSASAMPMPATSHTPPFASEEQALDAAKATYQGYLDALNKVDVADPETFEGVYSWLTGDALNKTRETLSTWHDEGRRKSGSMKLRHVNLVQYLPRLGTVSADVCVDLSGVELRTSTGESLSGPGGTHLDSYRVAFVPEDSSARLLISESKSGPESKACR